MKILAGCEESQVVTIEHKSTSSFHLLGAERELYLMTGLSSIDTWLENNWIVEIQEPEFTRDDMIDFGMNCHHILDDIKTMNIPLAFDEWVQLKQ